MTCEEIVKKLRTLKIPVAYSHFNKAPAIPFCVYTIPESSFYGADNKNMLKNRTVHIELYTDHKDETLENKVAALFNDHEIEVYEDYIEDQQLYQVVFEFADVIKTGG
ncbi:MAG: hypothetical protein J6P66_06350 [Bacteroidaceae bacterium]|nr:hypothetical protein [Bacteroidaceae bacterium]MBR3535689.1 hypothetical protein [Oscillospiraceae bacterium]